MLIIIGSIIGLAIITGLIMHFSPKSEEEEIINAPNEECCGAHEVCETDLLKKLSAKIVYFEDEELNVFQEIPANAYKDEAIEQFREVLYTLKKKEINDWLHSLELRRIAVPDILKPEVRMLLSD